MHFKILFIFSLMPTVLFAETTQSNIVPEVIITQTPVSVFTQNRRAVLPVQIVTQQQIMESGAQNVGQALQSAGVQVSGSAGGNNTQVSLRGFGDNATQNVLILVNGMPIQQPDIGAVNINQIPIQNVDHIEIWNGGASTQYGDQAVGGVVNIVTQSPKETTRYLQVKLGNDNTRGIAGGITKKFKQDLVVGMNAQHIQTDNYRHHNAESDNNFNANLDKHWQSGLGQLSYFLNQQWLQYPGALTSVQVKQNRRQTQALNDRDFNQQLNQLLQGKMKQVFSDQEELTMPMLFTAMDANGRLSNFNYTQARHEGSAQPEWVSHFSLHQHEMVNHVNLGGDTATYSLHYLGIYATSARQTELSMADILNTTITGGWHLITGYRYALAYDTQYDVAGNNLNNNTNARAYDFGLSWQINPMWRIYLRDNQVFRFPKVDENVNTNTGKPLKSQTGLSYEAGITWKNKTWVGMLSLYQINMRNEISTVPIFVSAETKAVNENLPPTERQGVILNNTWNINQHWSWAVMYQYVHAIFDSGAFNGNLIPFVSSQNVATHVIYQINHHWQVYAESIYIGPRRLANDVAARSPKLGGYTVYNVNVNYQYRQLQLALQLQNMTNKMYFDYALSVYNGPQTFNYYYPATGRTLLLTATYQL